MAKKMIKKSVERKPANVIRVKLNDICNEDIPDILKDIISEVQSACVGLDTMPAMGLGAGCCHSGKAEDAHKVPASAVAQLLCDRVKASIGNAMEYLQTMLDELEICLAFIQDEFTTMETQDRFSCMERPRKRHIKRDARGRFTR